MIEVIFPTGYDEVTIPALNQWDYGQVLNISGIDLSSLSDPSTVQVHFSDKSCVDAKVRLGAISNNKIAVQIPDILLANQYDVHAFIYLTNPNSGVTIKKIIIPVIPRKKPEDYVAIDDNFYESALQAIENKVDVIKTQAFDEEQKAKGRSNIDAMVDITEELKTAFTDTQKAQARTNIDVYSKTEIDDSVVKYSSGQSLTDTQKAQARTNIGAVGSADSQYTVKVVEQSFTDTQKAQARTNIDVYSKTEIDDSVVKYSSGQSLTNEQKAQARTNIGAVQADELKKWVPRLDAETDLNTLGDMAGVAYISRYTPSTLNIPEADRYGHIISYRNTAGELSQFAMGTQYPNKLFYRGSAGLNGYGTWSQIDALNTKVLYGGTDFTGSATKTFSDYADFKYLVFTVQFAVGGHATPTSINVIGSCYGEASYCGGSIIDGTSKKIYSVEIYRTGAKFSISSIGYYTFGATDWSSCLNDTSYRISRVVGIR